MDTWRVPLVSTGIMAIMFLTSIGLVSDAYADDYSPYDNDSCVALPGSTSWDNNSLTCTKSGGGAMTIGSGDTLTIPNGVTLEITSNQLRTDPGGGGGIITNNGNIVFSGTSIQIHDNGAMINNGDIVHSGNNVLRIRIGGSMINNGDFTFTNNEDLVNEGKFTNNGLIDSTSGGDISSRGTATFTNSGTLELDSTITGTARLDNRDFATFVNTGSITLEGPANTDSQIRNLDDAIFTNSGTITITGTNGNSGQLRNQDSASFSNSGTITITGTNGNSGQLRNQDSASFSNSGTITVTGSNNSSGEIRNFSILINSGVLLTNVDFQNNDADSALTNSGIVQVTNQLENDGGSIINNCGGEVSFGTFSGNPIEEEDNCPISSGSYAYEDPTIGKSHDGRQVVENGICIDIRCWTVTANYHQDFELVEMLSDSVHTISTTVFCQHGVHKCNYVAFGVSPYGTNINDSVWKIILQKDHRDNWTMKVIDPEEYLGEVTSTTQIVNDNRYLTASATIEFKKPTPGMILNIEVRDSGGGYRDFKFNDGVEIVDAYAYPKIETSYDPPLEIKPLCLNENVNKRYTCAFEKVREWTIKNAESALEKIYK